MKHTQLIDWFQRARQNTRLATIEGVQALKHATRFNADFQKIITCDINLLNELLDELAPDVKAVITKLTEEVPEDIFAKLSPQPPRTKVIAIAARKDYQLELVENTKPIILLEDPRDLENIGAVIRVAAAADAGAVAITGPANIWHPAVIRGAAGLHYALPIFNWTQDNLQASDREIVSLDPTGGEVKQMVLANTILVFGTERFGISPQFLAASDTVVRLPMRQGVSSLNLATSVAATLYRWG